MIKRVLGLEPWNQVWANDLLCFWKWGWEPLSSPSQVSCGLLNITSWRGKMFQDSAVQANEGWLSGQSSCQAQKRWRPPSWSSHWVSSGKVGVRGVNCDWMPFYFRDLFGSSKKLTWGKKNNIPQIKHLRSIVQRLSGGLCYPEGMSETWATGRFWRQSCIWCGLWAVPRHWGQGDPSVGQRGETDPLGPGNCWCCKTGKSVPPRLGLPFRNFQSWWWVCPHPFPGGDCELDQALTLPGENTGDFLQSTDMVTVIQSISLCPCLLSVFTHKKVHWVRAEPSVFFPTLDRV